MQILKLGFLLCNFVTLFSLCGAHFIAAHAYDRAEIAKQLQKMSDTELKKEFETIVQKGQLRFNDRFELCLLEFLDRGNQWKPLLESTLDELNRADPNLIDDQNARQRILDSQHNLELITALHRIQEKPDPVIVEIDTFETRNLSCIALPRLNVSLKNVSKSPVNVSRGGNYRSGRLTRWRIILTDQQGKQIPVKPWPLGMGGGIMSFRPLAPGESEKTELVFAHMVDAVPPGKYRMQVIYHDTAAILQSKSLDNYILCKSTPIEVVFKPVEITVNETTQSDSQQWIKSIDPDLPVRVLTGKYGQWAEDFISQESRLGKLLTLGLPAIPNLIETLNQQNTSPKLRAQILSTLYSITNLHDPRVSRSLGSYKYLSDAYSFGGASVGQSSGSIDRGSINEADQKALIERWNEWLKSTVVVKYE